MITQNMQSSGGQATPYWQNVHMVMDREEMQKPLVYITSLDKPMRGIVGGRVFGANPKVAAQRIVEETHRYATAEEVMAEQKRLEAEGQRLAKIEEDRKNTMIHRSTPEDDQRMAGIVAAAVSSVVNSKSKGGN